MKCQVFMISLTVLCVFCVNEIQTIQTADFEDLSTAKHQLTDVPARMTRFVENADARNNKYFITLKKNIRKSLIDITARTSIFFKMALNVTLNFIESTANKDNKDCYQPLNNFAAKYPTNLKDLQISDEIYNIFQSCQPDNKTVILNAVDCVNATMKKQQLVDPNISLLLETIKNAEIAVRNCTTCEKSVYDTAMKTMLTFNNMFTPKRERKEKNEAEQLTIYERILSVIPINQLSTTAQEIASLSFDPEKPNPWLDNNVREVALKGPGYSQCIALQSFYTIMYTGIMEASMCHQPFDKIEQELSEKIANLQLISDQDNLIYRDCHLGTKEVTVSSMECVNKTMAEQGVDEPKISSIIETLKNVHKADENMKKCQLKVAKELESQIIKMTDDMHDCVIVTMIWNVFQ